MSNKTINLTDDLYAYLLRVSLREPEILRDLRETTLKMPMAAMQIAPEQGQFMAFLVSLMGARKTLEIGVFTGYSALAVALALPADGKMVACDISEEYTRVARDFWARAGVSQKIDLRLAPAGDTLQGLIDEGQQASFDFAFIDADKTAYLEYYEQCLTLLRPGGVVAVDNVLWGGAVLAAQDGDADTLAICQFNNFVKTDERVSLTMLPVGDGLTLLRKH